MKKRYLYILCIMLVLCFSTVGVTYAANFYTDNAKITNTVNVGKIDIGVKETIKQWKEDVGIGIPAETAKCWVRVMITNPTTLDGEEIYEFSALKDNWILNPNDGFYYYKYPVDKSDSETVLPMYDLINMKEKFAKEKQDAIKDDNYNIIIYAESVQYSDGEPTGDAVTDSSAIDAFKKLQPTT